MGFYVPDAVCERQEQTHPRPKNRVMGSRRSPALRARRSAPQPLETHRKNGSTPTTTASGVRFYGKRYYGPSIGRFLSRDPIEELGSFAGNREMKRAGALRALRRVAGLVSDRSAQADHTYGFVGNDPVDRTDYLGLIFGFPDPFPGYGDIPGIIHLLGRKCPKGEKWVEKPGIGPKKPDGCSFPSSMEWILPGDKDDPVGGCSFKSACDAHDLCYAKCSGTQDKHPYSQKTQCDTDFYNAMKSACESCYGGKSDIESQLMLWACKQWATYYHDAVQMFGVLAYLNDNQLARCH